MWVKQIWIGLRERVFEEMVLKTMSEWSRMHCIIFILKKIFNILPYKELLLFLFLKIISDCSTFEIWKAYAFKLRELNTTFQKESTSFCLVWPCDCLHFFISPSQFLWDSKSGLIKLSLEGHPVTRSRTLEKFFQGWKLETRIPPLGFYTHYPCFGSSFWKPRSGIN